MGAIENLEVRQKGIELAKEIYILVRDNEKFSKDFGLKDQIQRCVVSIPSNIAEGGSRGTDKEFVRFLYISRGSCSELKTQLIIAKEIGYISDENYKILNDKIMNIHRMINGLLKSLVTRH